MSSDKVEMETVPLRTVTVLIKLERKISTLFCTTAGQLDQPIRSSEYFQDKFFNFKLTTLNTVLAIKVYIRGY